MSGHEEAHGPRAKISRRQSAGPLSDPPELRGLHETTVEMQADVRPSSPEGSRATVNLPPRWSRSA